MIDLDYCPYLVQFNCDCPKKGQSFLLPGRHVFPCKIIVFILCRRQKPVFLVWSVVVVVLDILSDTTFQFIKALIFLVIQFFLFERGKKRLCNRIVKRRPRTGERLFKF